MLPPIALVDKKGFIYDDVNADSVPPEAAWAQDAINALKEELGPTGDSEKDRLKDKLVQAFTQAHGRIVFTQGKQNLSILYETSANKSRIDRSLFRTWLVKALPGPKDGALTGSFHRGYKDGQPDYRVVFDATSFPAISGGGRQQELTITNPEKTAATEKFGDPAVFSVHVLPTVHEFTHAATAAGHFLSTGDESQSDDRTTVKTEAFSTIMTFEKVMYAGSTLMVVNGLFEQDGDYKRKKESMADEVLAYATGEYFGAADSSKSPMLDHFIRHVLSYDLDLILRGDREGQENLLTALDDKASLEQTLLAAQKIAALIRGKAPAEELRAARDEMCAAVGQDLQNLVAKLRQPVNAPQLPARVP